MPQKQNRKYLVVKANPDAGNVVSVRGKDLRYGKKTQAFTVSDPGVAREIEAQHGQKLVGNAVVVPIGDPGEPGHRRSFLVPELPWHRKAS